MGRGQYMRKLKRIDELLQRLSNPIVFFVGFELLLINSIGQSAFFWLFLPGSVSKILRYVALGLVLVYALIQQRTHPGVLLVYGAVLLILYGVTHSTRIAKYSLVLLLPLGELFERDARHSWIVWLKIVLAGLVMVSSANVVSPKLMDLLVLIFSAESINFKKIAVLSLVTTTLFVAAIIVGSSLGVVPDYLMSGRVRHMMGFRYALYPARYLFLITCLIIYLEDQDIGIPEIVALVVANGLVYKLSDSRLTFLSALAILVVALLLKVVHIKLPHRALVRSLAICIVPLCVVVAIVLAASFNPDVEWMAKLNSILTGRLRLGRAALNQYGIPLFGQEIEFIGNGLSSLTSAKPTGSYNYVDSMYVQLLVNFGPVVLVLFVLMQMGMISRAFELHNRALIFVLLMFAVQGIVDDASLSLQYNTFLLFASGLLINPSRTKQEPNTAISYGTERNDHIAEPELLRTKG